MGAKSPHARAADSGPIVRRWRAGLIFGLTAWGVSLLLGALGVTRPPNLVLYDALSAASADQAHPEEIGLIHIGDYDLRQLREDYGAWPWVSRLPHAVAIRELAAFEPKVIGLDILFRAPSVTHPEVDQTFAEEVALAPNVAIACLFRTSTEPVPGSAPRSPIAVEALERNGDVRDTVDSPRTVPQARDFELPIDGLVEATAGLGHINAVGDPDGAIRRVPLLVRYGNRLYPSIALRMVLLYWGLTGEAVVLDEDRGEVRIRKSEGELLRIPIDSDGLAWVRFERQREDYRAERFWYLVNGEADESLLKDRLVLIGVDTSGAHDSWPTPVREAFPGFLIQAQVIENLLTGRFVTVRELDTAPFSGRAIWVTFLVAAASVLLSIGALFLRPAVVLALTLVGGALPIGLSSLLFLASNQWVPPVTASVALLAAGTLGMVRRLRSERRERERMRRVYERYLAPRILEKVLTNPKLLEVGGARKKLTVCFTDIRGFVSLCQELEPEELTSQTNEYFTAMTEIIRRYEGTLDKLIGDAVMIFFNDPTPQPDHALRCVRMALDMQEAVAKLNAGWEPRGMPTFEVGIGIATGYATVGNFGSEAFTDYTVVGNTVHLAQRIEDVTPGGKIWVSAQTHHEVREQVEAKRREEMTFKGIAKPQEVYEITGLAAE